MSKPTGRTENSARKKKKTEKVAVLRTALQSVMDVVRRNATARAFGAHINRFAVTSKLADVQEPWGVIDVKRGRVFLAFNRVGDLMGGAPPEGSDWQMLFDYWKRAHLCVPGVVSEMDYPPAFPPQPAVCFYLKRWLHYVEKSLTATDGEDA